MTPSIPIGRRLLTAIATFTIVASIYMLAPHRLPGEQPDAELRGTGAPLCASCPWEQQITGVGLERAGYSVWLTVRFAAPPQDARLAVVLGDAVRRVSLQQASANAWTLSAPAGSDVPLEVFRVAMRGDRVVWEMPADLAGSGIAVASGDRRFPASGLLSPSAAAPPRRNVVDLLVALALAAGAILGWRRGFASAAWQLAGCGAALVLARALFEPAGALLGRVNATHSTAEAYIAALAAATLTVWLAARGLRRPLSAFLGGETGTAYRSARAALAVACGVAWAAAIAAMALSLGSELVALDAAYRAIQGSPAAQLLISGWNALFPPLV